MVMAVEFTGPRRAAVKTYPSEPLPAGHLRVRTRYSGISAGTELTAYRGTNPYLTRSWDPALRLFTSGSADFRPMLGYSEVGVVTEVAPDLVSPSLPAVGDLVWGAWGHRSEAAVPAGRLAGHVVPPGVSPLAGSFARIGAIALNAVLAADLHLGESVAVFGQGVIGLLVTRLAALSGATVVAVDALDPRREMSLRYGATAALPPPQAAEQIRQMTGGLGADTAIEVSGVHAALHEAIRSVGVGGRVVAAGFYQGDGLGLRLGEEFHHNRVQLVCSQIGGVPPHLAARWDGERLQRVFLQQVAAGALDVAGLVTHIVPVDRAAEAYELLDRSPADALQVVLEFPDQPI